MITVYIALGTNVGERDANLLQALELLPESGVHIRRVSSIYETEPVDYLDQEWFLNAVLEGETELDALDLLSALRVIEARMGSKKALQRAPGRSTWIFCFMATKRLTPPNCRCLTHACSSENSCSSRSRKSLRISATRAGSRALRTCSPPVPTTAPSKNSMTLPASSLFVAHGRLTTTLQLVRRSTNRCNVNIFGCSASSSICDNPPSLTSRQRYTPGSDSVCSRPFNRRRNSRASSAEAFSRSVGRATASTA